MIFGMRRAILEEHKEILAIAKTSPYTRDFGHMMFSSEEAYTKGWIRVCVGISAGVEKIIGFTCVRHKVRSAETSLYFIGLHPDHQDKGIGEKMLSDLKCESPHKRIALNVENKNEQALAYYRKHDFIHDGTALKGKGVHLILDW